jgi:hypothetical protein
MGMFVFLLELVVFDLRDEMKRRDSARDWYLGGTAANIRSYVRLTPAASSQNGWITVTRPLPQTEWSVLLELDMSKKGGNPGGQLALEVGDVLTVINTTELALGTGASANWTSRGRDHGIAGRFETGVRLPVILRLQAEGDRLSLDHVCELVDLRVFERRDKKANMGGDLTITAETGEYASRHDLLSLRIEVEGDVLPTVTPRAEKSRQASPNWTVLDTFRGVNAEKFETYADAHFLPTLDRADATMASAHNSLYQAGLELHETWRDASDCFVVATQAVREEVKAMEGRVRLAFAGNTTVEKAFGVSGMRSSGINLVLGCAASGEFLIFVIFIYLKRKRTNGFKKMD